MALDLTLNGKTHRVEIVRRRPVLVLRIDGVLHEVADLPARGEGLRGMVVDGVRADWLIAGRGEARMVRMQGRTHLLTHVDPRAASARGGAARDQVVAPMPGAVVSVEVAPGDAVTRGQTVATIESMKLQTALVAPRDGVIAEVLRSAGETFDKDAVIALLEPIDAEG